MSTTTQFEFGIDFGPVDTIPANPKDRSEYFASFRRLLKKEKEKIKIWHRSGAGGREVIHAHCRLIDAVLQKIVSSLASVDPYCEQNILDQFALAAVGGYGRGELNPCSDIDLLFVLPKTIEPKTDQFIQDLISVLWGIDLEIGHSCRTIKDCLQMGNQDLTIKTSMIEMRYLVGNLPLFNELRQTLTKNLLKKNPTGFLTSKLKEKYARYDNTAGVVSNPEPDIKNGPGGLRDYHTALWAGAACFGAFSLKDIDQDEIISNQELAEFERSVDFSLRVRNELHYLTGKKSDAIDLSIQADLATNLGYDDGQIPQRVERFMRDYFLHATNIYKYSELIYDRCLSSKQFIKRALSSLQKKDLGNGFYALKSTLMIGDDIQEQLTEDRSLLLSLFDVCLKNQLDLDPQLKSHIRLNLHLLDDKEFLNSEEIRHFIFRILDHPQSSKILRLMHEVGVLGKILPEFGQTDCLVRFDFYHRFTSDEHSLRMIQFLEELPILQEKDLQDLSRIYEQTPYKRLLKLSALLQFMGTGREHPTPPTGPDSIAFTAHRLKLNPVESELLQFLINNLNEMTETAFHRDIKQPATIKALAEKVATIERLNLLYALCYAELKAVAPDTWTAWKSFLLSEVHLFLRGYLQNPESINERPRITRYQVYQQLQGELSSREIEEHLEMMPEDYLATVQPERIVLHLHLTRSLDGKLFVLHQQFNEKVGYHSITLCSVAGEETFKKMVGSLTANNLNILGAQVYLRRDGVILITIQVDGHGESDQTIDLEHVFPDLEKNLEDVLENRKDIRDLLKSRKRYVVGKNKPRPITPKIQIDNTTSPAYTVVRVEARDHIGMLYKIAKILADFQVQIHRAKIACKGDRGVDVFYVTLRDTKITFKHLTRRIKENLINVLLSEQLEDLN